MSRAWGDEERAQGPAVRREDLVEHLRTGCKSPEDWLLGLEQEKLGVRPEGRALPFYGEGGVEEVLAALEPHEVFQGRREEGHLVGLEGPGGAGVSLEPGGQIEFISVPRSGLEELERDLCDDLGRVLEASGDQKRWLALGLQPVTPLSEMEWISRERYRIMARHMGARGDLAHRMMTQTAGVQLNVDFSDDADAARKLRTAMGVTSIVTAAFANSPFSDGKPNGWASYRSYIWTRTDPERCGLIRQAVEGEGMDLEAWTDWALDVPLMFVIRDGAYRAIEDRTFRTYMEQGWGEYRADLSDWEIHLTTLFPEVRVKTYMEVRGVDGVSRPLTIASVALWKGILYSRTACDEAWRLLADATWEERQELHEAAGRHGTAGTFRGRSLEEWALDLTRIAREGLRDPSRAIPDPGEERFLEPLEEQLIEGGGSPALDLLERWEGEWAGDPEKLVRHTALTPCQIRVSDV